jgi:hypothetical protein
MINRMINHRELDEPGDDHQIEAAARQVESASHGWLPTGYSLRVGNGSKPVGLLKLVTR